MKLVISLYEVENLIRNHYKLSGGDRIVVSRPRKGHTHAADQISTLTPVKQDWRVVIRLIDGHLASNNKIGAIKEYRTATLYGLKEAKDAIESWETTRAYIVKHGVYPQP